MSGEHSLVRQYVFSPCLSRTVDDVLRPRRLPADHRGVAAIRLVAPHAGLFAEQQIWQYGTVGDIGRRGDRRVGRRECNPAARSAAPDERGIAVSEGPLDPFWIH
jgi:hypothetical protein